MAQNEENNVSLLAKWLPSEGKADHDHYVLLRNHLNVSPRQYRKVVTRLRSEIDVVEQKMCENNWTDIEYSEVPSQAINIYRRAFERHDPQGFKDWVDDVYDEDQEDEEVKANAIYPHQITDRFIGDMWGGFQVMSDDERRMLQAQWDNLPDYIPDGRNILPVCDTSGSMTRDHAINVSLGLGLYISERNGGPFEDYVATFSQSPDFVKIESDGLDDRVQELEGINWGSNTDFESLIRGLLKLAVRHNVDEEFMPETVLVLSDMQFDRCVREPDDSAYEMFEREYKEAGYELPNIVFWNLRDSSGNPVKFSSQGTALVSGFSPSILENVLEGGNLTPISIVMETINDERYDPVTL